MYTGRGSYKYSQVTVPSSLSFPGMPPQSLLAVHPNSSLRDLCLQAEVAAVVMTGGLAHVCLVTSHMTVTRARIDMNIPRKRAGSSDHQKAISRFYEAVYQVRTKLMVGLRLFNGCPLCRCRFSGSQSSSSSARHEYSNVSRCFSVAA